MTVSATTAEHSLEHAMPAYHTVLPHGAGLIMISKGHIDFGVEIFNGIGDADVTFELLDE